MFIILFRVLWSKLLIKYKFCLDHFHYKWPVAVPGYTLRHMKLVPHNMPMSLLKHLKRTFKLDNCLRRRWISPQCWNSYCKTYGLENISWILQTFYFISNKYKKTLTLLVKEGMFLAKYILVMIFRHHCVFIRSNVYKLSSKKWKRCRPTTHSLKMIVFLPHHN